MKIENVPTLITKQVTLTSEEGMRLLKEWETISDINSHASEELPLLWKLVLELSQYTGVR